MLISTSCIGALYIGVLNCVSYSDYLLVLLVLALYLLVLLFVLSLLYTELHVLAVEYVGLLFLCGLFYYNM